VHQTMGISGVSAWWEEIPIWNHLQKNGDSRLSNTIYIIYSYLFMFMDFKSTSTGALDR
jgi:hypothetical protein